MKEKPTKEINIEEDYEKIRQVPLEEPEKEPGKKSPPVGSSYMGGPVREREGTRRRSRAAAKGSGRKQTAPKTLEKRGRAAAGAVKRKEERTIPLALFFMALVIGIMAGLGGGYYMWGWERPYTVDLESVEMPKWVEQDFIRKNIFSRPDVSRKRVNQIVIHYVANPGSTALGNRNYFDSLADQDTEKEGASVSSHFIVGLEGEVIQCMPIDEIAYANAPRNDDTIAIEVCHPDESGQFNEDTYDSVVALTAWLCKELKLSSKDVIRHYDVNGKECPKYFVDYPKEWDRFQADVEQAIKETL